MDTVYMVMTWDADVEWHGPFGNDLDAAKMFLDKRIVDGESESGMVVALPVPYSNLA